MVFTGIPSSKSATNLRLSCSGLSSVILTTVDIVMVLILSDKTSVATQLSVRKEGKSLALPFQEVLSISSLLEKPVKLLVAPL